MQQSSRPFNRHVISVIVPVHRRDSKLPSIRRIAASASTLVELIIVINNKELIGTITPEHPNEKVIICEQAGRGYAFVRGALQAEGDIILLLHSDTLLPIKWNSAIIKALENPKIVGGGFSMTFDVESLWLKMLIRLSDVRVYLAGEILGDRAIFVRANILKNCLPLIDIPIFDDVELSKCMRRQGKILLLKERVVTSADAFVTKGIIRNLVRIAKCRIWYALGGNPKQIYTYYYS